MKSLIYKVSLGFLLFEGLFMKKINGFIALTLSSFAQESHYELGIGAGVVTYPSYVGSKSNNRIISPIPYLRYEGEKMSLAKGGLKYNFFNNDKITIDLSLGASLPVESDNVPLRNGMEDLDFTLELGPRLNYEIHKDQEHEVTFKLPVRMVVATDIKNFGNQGFFIAPNLNYVFEKDDFRVKLKTGPLWADSKYHNYFYGVGKQDVTLARNAYDAKEGYNGYRNTLSLKYRKGAWNYGAFVSHINIDGATFEDSPLIETKNALYLGTFISYVFYEG